jgi:ABC-type transporter Mla MlaB component
MNVDIQSQEHLIRVCVRGPCTIFQAAQLRRALSPLAGETTAMMVELDQITELDSDGLQLLLNLRNECRSVFFCYANSLVQKTLVELDLHQKIHEPY